MQHDPHRAHSPRSATPVNDPVLRLAVRGPFHLEATVRVLQRRPANPVDLWLHDRYQRVLAAPGGPVLVSVWNRGTIDVPDVCCSLRRDLAPAARAAVVSAVRRILGLDRDPRRLQRAASREAAFRAIAPALRGMRPPRFASLFEAFANVVPFQQLSLEAGVAIVTRLVARFGEPLAHDRRRYFAFPEPRTIAAARLRALRGCGLSARKAETLRSLARLVAAGELQESRLESLRTPDALRTLVDLPGIGPWSAAVVLLRGLGRLDVFPPGDAGAARGLNRLLGRAPGAPIERVVERFGAQRGYLYLHILGASLLANGLIRAAPHQRHRTRLDRHAPGD